MSQVFWEKYYTILDETVDTKAAIQMLIPCFYAFIYITWICAYSLSG